MKTFALLLIVSFRCIFSQSSIPPSPFSDGYVQFDGSGDFLRTSNDERVDLLFNQTDDFTIETRMKITSPFVPMQIMGKYSGGTGWMISYHTAQWGELSFQIGSVLRRIYVLGNDTSWHSYKITFSKQNLMLETYVDDSLTNSYSGIVYSGLQNNAAFSIGNTGLMATYGFNSVNLYDRWFKGAVDYFMLTRNNTPVLNYSFNDGSGQYAMDSLSYFLTDRTLTGVPSCGSLHLMLGYMPASDTCDPEWVTDENLISTNFTPLSSGTRTYIESGGMTGYMESSSFSLTVWNGYLVNGGFFNRAGGVEAKHIALWDGNVWSSVGGGLNHEVVCLASYNGSLYAGGFFDSAYGYCKTKHIAKWDGNQWKSLGTGANNFVLAMKEFDGKLIVGGYFISVGEIYAPYIAAWDGTEWQSLGIGMSGPVWALCEYNGELYAGGNFQFAGTQVCNGIAKWKNGSWTPVGSGLLGGDRTIYSLCVYENELWAGGDFLAMNGIPAGNIARYNGTVWNSAGSGASGFGCNLSGGNITDMQVYNGSLYAVGAFTKMDGFFANKIARYNGGVWYGVEFGADLRTQELEVYNGELIVSGDFYGISAHNFNNIAAYKAPAPLSNGNNSTARKFILSQNYPNPFNPNTVISYQLAVGSIVKLTVYDVRGKEVVTLVNEKQNSGTYNVTFSGSGLASGVYFYNLTAGDLVEVKKMVLVK